MLLVFANFRRDDFGVSPAYWERSLGTSETFTGFESFRDECRLRACSIGFLGNAQVDNTLCGDNFACARMA